MSTPFEESLAAALRARFASGARPAQSVELTRDRLAIDLPAGTSEINHGELADAIAEALDGLLREPR